MPNESVVEVISSLTRATLQEAFKWQRTDDQTAYLLTRPQGTVTVGATHWVGDYPYLFVRFSDPDGSVAFVFEESSEPDPLDRPVRALWNAAADSASEVNKVMNAWLTDINENVEPF